jgi:hypothetical protein
MTDKEKIHEIQSQPSVSGFRSGSLLQFLVEKESFEEEEEEKDPDLILLRVCSRTGLSREKVLEIILMTQVRLSVRLAVR